VPADKLSTATHSRALTAVTFRTASLLDAHAIWRIVHESGVLDVNSHYCYLLLCRDFADTCVVACQETAVVGFVTAYRPPSRPRHIFVWQVGVDSNVRRQGLAKRLLHQLVSLPACQGVQFLEATITPSNTPSRRLFTAFANDLHVPCRVVQGFTAEVFSGQSHEAEETFRIGPLEAASKECLSL
jgi:L-2,4-diaminobutyric acid acetyltransferase